MATFLRLRPFPIIDRPPFSERLPSLVRHQIDAINRQARRPYLKRILGARDFPIIASNCWGAGIYQDLDRPFYTPFIGLYLRPPCFLKFITNYEQARVAPLSFIEKSRYVGAVKYPLGLLLDDIEIHFVHYESREEARDKWQRRCQRLPENPDDAYYMLGSSDETLEDKRAFAALPLRSKVLFSAQPTPGFTDEIIVRPWRGVHLEEGPMLYDHCHAHFDIVRWLMREN